MNSKALNELIEILQGMTPEQLDRFLHHPSTVQILQEARNGGCSNEWKKNQP